MENLTTGLYTGKLFIHPIEDGQKADYGSV